MTNPELKRLRVHEPAVYHIRVQGQLDERWTDYCGGMSVRVEEFGAGYPVTELRGQVLDQAALFGVLNFLYDNRLPLLSVEMVAEDG